MMVTGGFLEERFRVFVFSRREGEFTVGEIVLEQSYVGCDGVEISYFPFLFMRDKIEVVFLH
jgi:hypothetical protein